MDIERYITTRRLRLLRLTAWMLLALGFVLSAPFSNACRLRLREFVFSILTKAEAAAQLLVIVQARAVARRSGLSVDFTRSLQAVDVTMTDALFSHEDLPTLSMLRRRLRVLRAVLENLPRHSLRLLRRMIGKNSDHKSHADNPLRSRGGSRCAWRLVLRRVERPPDKAVLPALPRLIPPLRTRTGGARGWAAGIARGD